MKTEHLEYLLEVVKCRSINQASKKLHLNHQYLSQILTALEDELGVKLLERTRVGIGLTAEGRLAMAKIEAIVEQLHELRALLSGEAKGGRQALKGTFSIYCISSIEPSNIERVAQDLQAIYPGVDLVLRECSNEEAISAVRHDQRAIGQLLLSRQVPALWPELPRELELVILQERAIAAWVSKTSALLQQYDSITLKSLLKYNVVLYSPIEKSALPSYQILSSAAQGEPAIKCVTSNLNTFYRMLMQDKGIAIGTKRTFSTNKEVAMIPIRDNIKVIIALVVNKEALELSFVQDFIQHCRELYQEPSY